MISIQILISIVLASPFIDQPENITTVYSGSKGFTSRLQEFTLDMGNNKEVNYYLTLHIGDQKTPLKLIPDTGSRRLVLESYTCESCYSTKYDYSNNTLFHPITGEMEFNYGSQHYKGFRAQD
jgi:hypothetical protein